MAIFDTDFIQGIVAENDARAKAEADARARSQEAAAQKRKRDDEIKRLVDQALREFPAAAQQIGLEPFRVTYLGASPLMLKHHAKVWPVASWYCIDKDGNTYTMDHMGAYEQWIKKAREGKEWVDKVDRQVVIDHIAFQTTANIHGTLEESVRGMLAPYLRAR